MTEDEMIGWHHQLSGHESEQIPRDSKRQGRLACCYPLGYKESWTWLSNWTTITTLWQDFFRMLSIKWFEGLGVSVGFLICYICIFYYIHMFYWIVIDLLFISFHLFLAAVGLCCFTWVFYSWGEWKLLFIGLVRHVIVVACRGPGSKALAQ